MVQPKSPRLTGFSDSIWILMVLRAPVGIYWSVRSEKTPPWRYVTIVALDVLFAKMDRDIGRSCSN